ncbi:type II CRISPR-associated endonuclease Cas1 [Saccharicrinis sp. 156]|uniref:type II CRISPR-associated endonuclease Cas1 n=1 Tax=Saccharicrinis sp. 156 TaxID=3417574 RepID=UPI003D32B130
MKQEIIFITEAAYICVRQGQLVVHNKIDFNELLFFFEDIALLVLENPKINITLKAIQHLNRNNIPVICSDENLFPSSMLMNLHGNQVQNELLRQQLNASLPLREQLWQQTMDSRNNNQLEMLYSTGKSGLNKHNGFSFDNALNDNEFSYQSYISTLFGTEFQPSGLHSLTRSHLDYGYGILKAAVTNSLVGVGLLPTIGLQGQNSDEVYGLSANVMEPYKPFIDEVVYRFYVSGDIEAGLNQENKVQLLDVLNKEVIVGDKKETLVSALSRTTSSLVDCYRGNGQRIIYPKFAQAG